jgi:S1-C subfamily serine protease
LNSQGEVIGINTAVSSESQNIGFAIPVNVVKELVDNFTKGGGKILRPFIGVRYQMVSRETAILNNVPEGAFIVEVVENSPAQKAEQKEDAVTVSVLA